MKTVRALALFAFLLPSAALAEPVQVTVPQRTEAAPLQYMQSCMPGPLYSVQFTSALDAKVVVAPGATGTGSYPYAPRLLLKWGSQWKVSCDANGAVLACLHQSLTPTVSLGAGNDGGDGAGYAMDGTSSAAGQARCMQLTAATPTDFFKVSPASFGCSVGATARDPLTRCGRCSVVGTGFSVGAPCAAAADCGSGGTCDTTNRPDGVFLSFVPVSASSVCFVSRCDQ